jgi:hypothetical protein
MCHCWKKKIIKKFREFFKVCKKKSVFDPIFYPGRYPAGKHFLTHGSAWAKPIYSVGPTRSNPRKKKNPSKKPIKKNPAKKRPGHSPTHNLILHSSWAVARDTARIKEKKTQNNISPPWHFLYGAGDGSNRRVRGPTRVVAPSSSHIEKLVIQNACGLKKDLKILPPH